MCHFVPQARSQLPKIGKDQAMRTSHGGTPTRKNSSSSSPSFPAYLYRRGDIFYFRLRIPTGKQGKDVPSELRISLRTSYVRKANSLARHIYSELQALLQRGVDYQTIRKRLNGLLRVLLEKTIGSLILLSLMFQASMRSAMRNTLYVFFKIHISYY